jgi:hypothetical protein
MMPPAMPDNALKASLLAGQHGWDWDVRRVWVGHEAEPPTLPSVVLRLRKPGFPRLYAMWKPKLDGRGWSFHRAYVSTCQRLGWGDLGNVLKDPEILLDIDPDNPFGNENDGLPVVTLTP